MLFSRVSVSPSVKWDETACFIESKRWISFQKNLSSVPFQDQHFFLFLLEERSLTPTTWVGLGSGECGCQEAGFKEALKWWPCAFMTDHGSERLLKFCAPDASLAYAY